MNNTTNNQQTEPVMSGNNNINKINSYYKPLIRGIELLNSGDFTSLFCISKTGLGKSTIVDKTLERIKANFVVFSGDISEAKCYEFIQENSDKIIVFRDVGRLLRRIGFIEMLKAATDPRGDRIISRLTYAKHENVESSFKFDGKILIELNEISNRHKEDMDALLSRGIVTELNFSFEDIINLMKLIANTDEQNLVTEYLIKKSNLLGLNSFNLRVQSHCFRIYYQAVKDKLDWKNEIDMLLSNYAPEIRKIVYRLAGNNPVKRMDLVRFMMRDLRVSYATAQNRIAESIYLQDIFTNGLQKQALLSLTPFQ